LNNGIETGKKENSREIAIEMLKNGLDINLIHKTTKLSLDEIKELQKSL
jgi:predicted transposase/invertase (TIGR01784 family)